MKNSVEIFWDNEGAVFIATDGTRTGCVAMGSTEPKALDALIKARKAWDAAKRKTEASAS